MKPIEKFDAWFENLTVEEKRQLLNHIASSKFKLIMEGFYAGPPGELLKKGLFAGPTGVIENQKCPHCGK